MVKLDIVSGMIPHTLQQELCESAFSLGKDSIAWSRDTNQHGYCKSRKPYDVKKFGTIHESKLIKTHAKWDDIQIYDAMKGFHRRESE